jgi:hypothetical protein
MRSVLKAGLAALALIAMSFAAQAGTWEGVAIGAGSGMVIAGPPGAVVGGVVGGPDIGHRASSSPLLDKRPWLSPMRLAVMPVNGWTKTCGNNRDHRNPQSILTHVVQYCSDEVRISCLI